MNEMNDNFDVFDEYVKNYDLNNSHISYKYKHSYRVMSNCDKIAISLNLNEEENYIACLCGLLHDIGRFEQLKKYNSHNDIKTIDHGDYGAKILFEDNYIKNFKLSKDKYSLVKSAVSYHNKLNVPQNLSTSEKLYTNIVRDADKIDILYAFSTSRLLEVIEDDKEFSKEVTNSIIKHECVNRKYEKSKNDRILTLFSLIFDLNFDYSRKIILENGYLKYIYDNLQNKNKFKKYFDEVNNYLKGEK